MNEGLSFKDNQFIFNFTSDSEDDIIYFETPEIYQSSILGNEYFFGYRFTPTSSKQARSAFINWLKKQSIESASNDLISFIVRPIKYLCARIPIDTFDAIIYPVSNRSKLVNIIIDIFCKVAPHGMPKKSFEMIKNIPNAIYFDWDAFNANYDGVIGDSRYLNIYSYIEEFLMPKIHDLSYFSIAENVKPKYRKFIQNYLIFRDNDSRVLLNSIMEGHLIIIDDINTSGSTINEILKIIKAINKACEVYIFTLIGKD